MEDSNTALKRPSYGRMDWIDATRGIGVILVILVHSIIPTVNPITIHLSSFAIPLFFIFSGITHNTKKYRNNVKGFLQTRAKQLLIPYFCLYGVVLILFVPFSSVLEFSLTPNELFFWFIYGSGPPKLTLHLWFLPVLYFGMALFVGLDYLTQGLPSSFRWVLVGLLVFGAVLLQSFFSPMLVPWHLNAIFISSAFIIIGNETRRSRELDAWSFGSTTLDALALGIGSLALLLLSRANGFVDLAVDNTGNSIWLYLATGTLGTVIVTLATNLVMGTSERICGLLLRFGKHSQEVYEAHPLIFYLVGPVIMAAGVLLGWLIPVEPLGWIIRFVSATAITITLTTRLIRVNGTLRFIFTGRT
ncbi:MAG: acyltransferase family protein [Candidatus Thorarchaeota archaeon]